MTGVESVEPGGVQVSPEALESGPSYAELVAERLMDRIGITPENPGYQHRFMIAKEAVNLVGEDLKNLTGGNIDELKEAQGEQ